MSSVMGGMSGSVPIDSPQVRNQLIQLLVKKGYSQGTSAQWADCVIAMLKAQGVNTVGDTNGRGSLVMDAGAACGKKLGLPTNAMQ